VTCASLLPPSSRAIRPLTNIEIAFATTENSLSPTKDRPNIDIEIRSTKGVNGG